VLLGCIADDFTGATDLAGMLVRNGMRTVQTIGVPPPDLAIDADAVVVALKSRTNPAQAAIDESLNAHAWLRSQGAEQFYFKYCSTFDSTEQGNIGPVAEALLEATGAPLTVFCPALPVNGRRVYRGHLFVGDALLHESGMQNHPLTPMTDSSLLRVLAAQTKHRVGAVYHETICGGASAVVEALEVLSADGVRMVVVDAITDADLVVLGEACAELALVTGGSGLALGLPQNFRRQGKLAPPDEGSMNGLGHERALDLTQARARTVSAHGAVLAGSCSLATQEQVRRMVARHASRRLDPIALSNDPDSLPQAIAWAEQALKHGPVMLYASGDAAQVGAAQDALGVARAGEVVEAAFAQIAKRLVMGGVRDLVVAGGETSGAVVQALGVRALRIGEEIAPGVPWTEVIGELGLPEQASDGAGPLRLALKSGNFGTPDFFLKALER
jgi:uncharacterized protein YgbK (DUF1537 family)